MCQAYFQLLASKMFPCFQARAERALREGLTRDDAAAALRLVLNDAGTFDVESGTGGLNGSIVIE